MEEKTVVLNDEELKTALAECDRKSIVPGIAAFAGVALAVMGAIVNQPALFIVGIPSFVLGLIFFERMKKKKAKLISDNVTEKVLKDVFNITKYERKEHISGDVVKKTGLITSAWNRISGSDYFEGTYRGVRIACSDLQLVEVETHHTGKHTYTTRTTVFEGQWIVLKLGRPVTSDILVREKNEKLFGKGYRNARSDFEVEDAAFNEQYQIKAKDGHEVFYVLTPHFMEHIRTADKKACGRTGFFFTNDEVHFICYNNKNLFEIHGSMNNVDEIRKQMIGETRYITDVIDELLANEYLFGTKDGSSKISQ